MEDKFPKMVSLDKMITLIVYLLDRAQRYSPDSIGLSPRDFDSLISGRTFLFIQQQIRDNINLRQTYNLIVELQKLDDSLAPQIINMIFTSIARINENSTPFFKVLSFMAENIPVFSCFSKMILPRIWECCHHSSLQMLDWLIQHIPRNKFLHDHVMSTLDLWVFNYLLEDGNVRVRSNAAQLLISLVPPPDNAFRQNYRPFRTYPYLCKEIILSAESIAVIDKLYTYLVNLVKKLKNFSVNQAYGLQKLTNYFFVLSYFFLYTNRRKLFFNHFHDFWNFFSSKLSEPAIAIHQNKQAFLMFWYLVCLECPECVRNIVMTPAIYKKIAFNYILADHEDQDTILFNKNMLPYYYGLLKLCCRSSRVFTRYLATHQNIHWAFQNITPYPNHYSLAVKELFELMKLFTIVHDDATEEEKKEISLFKRDTLKMYLSNLNPSVNWVTIISVLNILMPTIDDRVFFIQINGLFTLFSSFTSLHTMFHEATACHITSELVELLSIISTVLSVFETSYRDQVKEQRSQLKDFVDVKKLIYLLNTYTPSTVRKAVYEVLGRLAKISPNEFMGKTATFLNMNHDAFHSHNNHFINGPYFPRRGQKMFASKSSIRPPKMIFQMAFHPSILDPDPVRDREYERSVQEFYKPYHDFVEMMARFALRNNNVYNDLVALTCNISDESLHFHSRQFIDVWLHAYQIKDKSSGAEFFLDCLENNKVFWAYMVHILTRERCFLVDDIVYEFVNIFLPKVS